ncbi:MAG: GGDEF domain-containing phosphodiesterase [Burkholderiales bacterium]|nr:GGDEF domain-containing phosphodiesterase [Burkholderiales bacterium]
MTSTPAASRIVTRQAIGGEISRLISSHADSALAVMMVELRRANRLQALTGGISADIIMEHAMARLDRVLRDVDRMAKLSNETLCLVLPKLGDGAQSVLAAVRVLSTLQKPFAVAGPQQEDTVTIRPHLGIALYPDGARDAEQLLIKADVAARIASSSESGYHIYRTEDRVETEIYRGLDIELSKAIKSNQLKLHYQPQIETATGACHTVEALLRWNSPGSATVSPAVLVGIAENTGLLPALTTWTVHCALRENAEMRRQGIDVSVAVNLSPRTLADTEFPDEVAQALAVWGVSPQSLLFEITEGSMIGDVERSLRLLNRLRDLGVKLAIDDFGTGYSSLAYLKRFPVHELKIDKMFVQAMRLSRGDSQIVRSVIDLAHNFDLRAVSEGVEDEATFNQLRELGCDAVQGFLFSEALGVADFMEWWRAHEARGRQLPG